jgi:hypothetical protein
MPYSAKGTLSLRYSPRAAGTPEATPGREPGLAGSVLICDRGGCDRSCDVPLRFELGSVYGLGIQVQRGGHLGVAQKKRWKESRAAAK